MYVFFVSIEQEWQFGYFICFVFVLILKLYELRILMSLVFKCLSELLGKKWPSVVYFIIKL